MIWCCAMSLPQRQGQAVGSSVAVCARYALQGAHETTLGGLEVTEPLPRALRPA